MRIPHFPLKYFLVFSFIFCFSTCKKNKHEDVEKVLTAITPIYQNQSEWCWVATGEMIFRYYQICQVNPYNYQCGIIAFLGPVCNANCFTCNIPAHDIYTIQNMLSQYPQYVNPYCSTAYTGIHSDIVFNYLSADEVMEEINNGRPVFVGIAPSASAGSIPTHASLLVGYEWKHNKFYVYINDPWPYPYPNGQDPYLYWGATQTQYGQYKMRYDSFIKNIHWSQSLKNVSP